MRVTYGHMMKLSLRQICQLLTEPTVPTFNICTKCVGSQGINHPIDTQFPGLGCIDDLATECSSDSKATWVIDMFGLFLWHAIHG